MVDEMRMAEKISKCITIRDSNKKFHVNYRTSFLYGTINGAKSLGIDHITGSLEVGKSFDAVIADIGHATEPEFVDGDTAEELLERFLHVGTPESVRSVFVAGKQVIKK